MESTLDDAVTIRVAGALSGVVQVPGGASATVGALRAQVAHLSGAAPHSIKLICGGKTLLVRF